jgi:xylulose-5-phosphate/fructose-6-phosphate phosphoketolase
MRLASTKAVRIRINDYWRAGLYLCFGMLSFFKQFSSPGGIGSHCTLETPGSIHEGSELGYSLSHAFGAAFDHPDLIVVVMVGDGEAETGPLATAWHSNKF